MKHKILVVTDHTTHSSSNSLYELALALYRDEHSDEVWVCSKGLIDNADFFAGKPVKAVYASKVTDDFAFNTDTRVLINSSIIISLDTISCILIRMPQPLNKQFLRSLAEISPPKTIVNDVNGTIETSSKEFLTTIPHLCPSPKMCYSAADAVELSQQYELVLKPMFSYGGRGIVRLSTDFFWLGDKRYAAQEIFNYLTDEYFPMLSMRYLRNVEMGDKRTIVVNRKIVGSALRMPPPDSWICNIAHGGHAIYAEPDESELAIEQELTPLLFKKGVIMYGFDTLVDDDGKRVLSEINTLSIGGLGPIEEMSGKPVLQQAASLLLDYFDSKI